MADLSTDVTPVVPGQPVGTPGVALSPARVGGHYSLLTRRDKVVLVLMLGIPCTVHLLLVWFPAISSIGLSFTRWNGIGGLSAMGSLFRLNDPGLEPLWLVDPAGAEPRMVFVPVSN